MDGKHHVSDTSDNMNAYVVLSSQSPGLSCLTYIHPAIILIIYRMESLKSLLCELFKTGEKLVLLFNIHFKAVKVVYIYGFKRIPNFVITLNYPQ